MTARIGRFHLITDANMPVEMALPKVVIAAAAGVTTIQVRFPQMDARDVLCAASAFRVNTEALGTRIVVNDRVDVAVAVDADGVHLGQRSLDVTAARRVTGASMTIGVSVHGVDEARFAAADGADYVLFGHVHATSSHPGEPGRGLEALRSVVEVVAPLPVIAVGGITAERVPAVLEAGAHGVAVIRAVLASDDDGKSARGIANAIERWRPAS